MDHYLAPEGLPAQTSSTALAMLSYIQDSVEEPWNPTEQYNLGTDEIRGMLWSQMELIEDEPPEEVLENYLCYGGPWQMSLTFWDEDDLAEMKRDALGNMDEYIKIFNRFTPAEGLTILAQWENETKDLIIESKYPANPDRCGWKAATNSKGERILLVKRGKYWLPPKDPVGYWIIAPGVLLFQSFQPEATPVAAHPSWAEILKAENRQEFWMADNRRTFLVRVSNLLPGEISLVVGKFYKTTTAPEYTVVNAPPTKVVAASDLDLPQV